MSERGLTRRQALRRGVGAGAGLAAAASGVGALAPMLNGRLDALLGTADAAARPHGSLSDIEHVIFLIQENRSFDHYFGTLRGVRGFADRRGATAFRQRDAAGRTVVPFHLGRQYCMPDITHDWGPQHESFNGGRMNRFVAVHEQVDGAGTGIETMGYYERSDLRFYYALADAFTICDGYHCSVMGPTDPNRLMSVSASIDPAGTHGGPLLQTLVGNSRTALNGAFRWTTMPERLQAHGVDWKVYMDQTGGGFLDNVLTYFAAYNTPGELADRALHASYPQNFLADIAHDALPKVSWILTDLRQTEHPGFSSAAAGEAAAAQIVHAVMSNPRVWRKTALFITWDENGGFFDHVAPPVPRRGTPGGFVTASPLPGSAAGVRGPIGLGFRVPMLIVSPFTRGGLVCSDAFDHTSMLRFVETRFGVEVPNLSTWRRRVTGDLTSAFNFAAAPDYGRARLPTGGGAGAGACTSPGPVRVGRAAFPHQEPGRRPRPSGIVGARHR